MDSKSEALRNQAFQIELALTRHPKGVQIAESLTPDEEQMIGRVPRSQWPESLKNKLEPD